MAIPPQFIKEYDDGRFYAQLKLNGACGILHFEYDQSTQLFERHKLDYMTNTRVLRYDKMFRRNFKSCIVIGEYMNKNKIGFDGKPFNHKFVVNDIIALDGVQLKYMKIEDRMAVLDRIMVKPIGTANYLNDYGNDIYRVVNIEDNFEGIYNITTKVDMVEGLVIKLRESQLADCSVLKNRNSQSMYKFRKPTKNYNY